MVRLTIVLLLIAPSALACSICGDGIIKRSTLRQQFKDSEIVLFGDLKNPVPGKDGIGGTTELHVSKILKGKADARIVVIPRYIPVLAQTPTGTLFFCTLHDGKLEPLQGVSATAATVTHLEEAVRQATLDYFISKLQDADEATAADAFLEVARAKDDEIAKLAAKLDRKGLRAWIADVNVPEERIGLYALLLGLCGDADDAAWLESLLKAPRNERAQANLAGLLAGLIVLDGPRGWAMIRGILEGRDNLGEVLHALSAVRCLQGMKPKEAKPEILKAYRLILAGDLCDLAVEDLRRWGWWDLTADVLALFKPEASPMLKRGLVRYALACPEEPAKKFLEKLRREDPKLVEKVESAAKGK